MAYAATAMGCFCCASSEVLGSYHSRERSIESKRATFLQHIRRAFIIRAKEDRESLFLLFACTIVPPRTSRLRSMDTKIPPPSCAAVRVTQEDEADEFQSYCLPDSVLIQVLEEVEEELELVGCELD